MDGDALALFVCINCATTFSACPMCVNTIRIDPETGLPPDALRDDDGNLWHNPRPNPEGVARSVKQTVCDACVAVRNEQYVKTQLTGDPTGAHIAGLWEPAEERHRRAHA